MSKIKQLTEYMVQDLVAMLSESQEIDYDEAMRIIYNSDVYVKLIDPETGLYRESSDYVFELLLSELHSSNQVAKV